MYGFHRLGSPIGFSPTNDTQFYLYFEEDSLLKRPIFLNQDEFTDYKWLSPEDALSMYQRSELPLFPP